MKTLTILWLTFFLPSVIPSSLAESPVPRASFGEICSLNGTRCDSQSFLTCHENKCQCLKPKKMKFDINQGKCLVLSGERCTFTAVEESQEKKWTEQLECVENAKCNDKGFCSCHQEYYEDSQGFCRPKRMPGQTCSNIQKCREDKYIKCVHGVCMCNDTDTVFDSSKNQCAFKVEKSCSDKKPCVERANCEGYSSWWATQGKCRCRDDYKTSRNGLCLAQYNMECNSQKVPCLEDLSCINGQCRCPFPDHQTYKNDGSNKCISFVRGPCKEDVGGIMLNFSCVPGAECYSINETGIHECRCSKGYIESSGRSCAIAYGQKCETSKGKNPCDIMANLICKNGKCVCPDFQVFNDTISKCQGLVGAKCSLGKDDGESFCVDGAYCQSYRDNKFGGVCECRPFWVADSNRRCKPWIPKPEPTASLNITFLITNATKLSK